MSGLRGLALAGVVLTAAAAVAYSDDPGETVPHASAHEPIREKFSAEAAARALDETALAWQQSKSCVQCHANLMYLAARPALESFRPTPPEVRLFYESVVRERWPEQGLRYDYVKTAGPQPVGTEAIVIAFGLVMHDRRHGRLAETTRKALDEMLAVQRDAGDWYVVTDSPADCFGAFTQTMWAALAIGTAPDDYAESAAAQTALNRIRTFVRNSPPATPLQRGMLLWAATEVEGLATVERKGAIIDELAKLQRADGGWSIGRLLADHAKRRLGAYADDRPSDGFGTGFVSFVLCRSGATKNDPRVRRAVQWLKSNQRESGRWFQESLVNRPLNVISQSATAWAVLALEAAGEL